MPEEIKTSNEIKSPVSDKPEAKKKKPILTILTGVLIVVLALLLLCLLPGRPIFGIILPKPKFTPIVTNLDPVQFQQITPPAGGGSSTVVFPVGSTTVTPPPFPNVELTANGSSEQIEINNGISANLAWETEKDPDECTASGDWSGSKDPDGGTEATGPLFATSQNSVIYSYKIVCKNQYGTAVDTISVKVLPPGGPPLPGNPPGTDLAVNGSDETIQIPNGTSANLTWDTENNPDNCNASGNWSGSKDPGGGSEITGPLSGPATYNYKITCSNQYGSSEDTVKIIVENFEGEPCINCPQPATVSSPLSFANNKLVYGAFPEYEFNAPAEGGKVNVSGSVTSPLGGPCLSIPGPFSVHLFDNNNPLYSYVGTDNGWSGNFPEFSVAPGSHHKIKLLVQTNCAGGSVGSFSAPIQSGVGFTDASMTITEPSPSVCHLNQQPSLPLNFANNKLVSGAFPEYKFTAFDKEKVKVSGSFKGFTGGPCLTPLFRVSLYDNNTLKFGPLNATGNSWSGSFPEFTVDPGQHSIRLEAAPNCTGGFIGSSNAPIQSSAVIPVSEMTVNIEYPTDFDGPEICPVTQFSNLFDFGDAPDANAGDFPSLLVSKGARHKAQPFFLGYEVDKEPNSYQVDEDSPSFWIGKDDAWDWQSLTITNANWPADKPIYLNVLYDLNNDLKWNNLTLEHIVVDKEFFIPSGEGVEYTLPLETTALIPNVPGSWVRFTVTDIKLGQNYNGSWPDPFEYGETEDYSRPIFFPPTKFPPKPPKGGGEPPGGGGGPGDGEGAGGGFRLELPIRDQAPAVPLWVRSLLKFINVNVDELILRKSSLVTWRDVVLRERTQPTLPVFKTIFEQVFIPFPVFAPIPTPEEPPVIQPPPTPVPTPTVSFPSVILIQDADTNGNFIVSVTCPPAGVDVCRLHVVGKNANNQFLYEDIFPTTNTRTFFLPLKNAIVAELFARVGSLQSSSVFVHSFVTGKTPSPPVVSCAAAPNITTTSLPDGRNGDAYSQTLVATGGEGSLTWSISSGSLPTNLSLSASTGAITGTPTSAGLASFTVQVADSCSSGAQTDTQALTINVL